MHRLCGFCGRILICGGKCSLAIAQLANRSRVGVKHGAHCCNWCGEKGHNIRRCPQRGAA